MSRRYSFLPNRIRRLAGDERGAALVATIGIAAALSIAGASAIDYSVQDAGAAGRVRSDTSSYSGAEAGINDALAVLANAANNPLDPTLLAASATKTYDGTTATWSGTLDKPSATWTITGSGSTRNPTGPKVSAVRRRVTVTVPVLPVYAEGTGSTGWNYVFSTRTGLTCDENVNGGVTVGAPMYVKGNMCLASGAKVTVGSLVVGQKLTLSAQDSAVGSSGAPISDAHIGSGCQYWSYATDNPCKGAPDDVYATTLDQTIPAVTPPTPAWDAWYTNAMPGPKQGCTDSSGTVPTFDTDSTRNNSVSTSFSLTPATSYSCRVGPANAPLGELSWDATAKVLTVRGTVFIDGSAKVDNGAVNRYVGQGSLYLSGTMLFTSSSKLCAATTATDCDWTGWNPNASFLAIVTNSNGGQVLSGNGVQLSNYAQFQGALYSTYTDTVSSYAKAQGPMVGSTIGLGSYSELKVWPGFTSSPVGLPGNRVVFAQLGAPSGYTG